MLIEAAKYKQVLRDDTERKMVGELEGGHGLHESQ